MTKRKTNVVAEDGRQDLLITREFDLPVELLFRAYAEADLVEQWMGTRVLKLESRTHGSWQFETTDGKGNVVVKMNGVIHEFSLNQRIIRTFEMENTSYGVQLEYLEFERVSEETSKLNMHVIYRSGAHRDRMLQLPFAYGVNMAHNKLQAVLNKLK